MLNMMSWLTMSLFNDVLVCAWPVADVLLGVEHHGTKLSYESRRPTQPPWRKKAAHPFGIITRFPSTSFSPLIWIFFYGSVRKYFPLYFSFSIFPVFQKTLLVFFESQIHEVLVVLPKTTFCPIPNPLFAAVDQLCGVKQWAVLHSRRNCGGGEGWAPRRPRTSFGRNFHLLRLCHHLGRKTWVCLLFWICRKCVFIRAPPIQWNAIAKTGDRNKVYWYHAVLVSNTRNLAFTTTLLNTD